MHKPLHRREHDAHLFSLVQLLKFKIIHWATCFLVVKLIHAHILIFNLYGPIVEWSRSVGACCHFDSHFWCQHLPIGTLRAFGRNTKYFTHKLLRHSFL